MDPEKLGPFRIGGVLGRGGMGAVYQGISETDGSHAAVKVLTASLDGNPEDRLRFESEIETLKRLHHPNIVRLTGFGEEHGRLYYVMELVDGPSLRQELRKGRSFQWYEAAQIGLELCQALRHAHDRGVIHRDIKPANILLDRSGNVKLSDFGIARFFGSRQITDDHSVIGTLEYMSPEQALAEPIGTVSDLYSLGCVLYVLLTGKPPFPARTLPELLRKLNENNPISIRTLRQDIPDEFGCIITDLLKIRPEDRPRNPMLVIKRLQSVLLSSAESETVVTNTVLSQAGTERAGTERSVMPPDAGVSALSRVPSSPRFTAVANPTVDPFDSEEPSRPIFSLPTLLASITLIVVGLTIHYLLQPVPPEDLLERITSSITTIESGDYTFAQLLSVQHDVRQFLSRYPHHPSTELVQGYQEELDLQDYERRLERRIQFSASGTSNPVEQVYVEILTATPNNPESTIDKLRAFIAAFQSAPSSLDSSSRYRFAANPVEICVELARRRLAKLEHEVAKIYAEQANLVRRRLDEAARIQAQEPERAEEIRQGIIELYQHYRWARELIEEAQHPNREPAPDRPDRQKTSVEG